MYYSQILSDTSLHITSLDIILSYTFTSYQTQHYITLRYTTMSYRHNIVLYLVTCPTDRINLNYYIIPLLTLYKHNMIISLYATLPSYHNAHYHMYLKCIASHNTPSYLTISLYHPLLYHTLS